MSTWIDYDKGVFNLFIENSNMHKKHDWNHIDNDNESMITVFSLEPCIVATESSMVATVRYAYNHWDVVRVWGGLHRIVSNFFFSLLFDQLISYVFDILLSKEKSFSRNVIFKKKCGILWHLKMKLYGMNNVMQYSWNVLHSWKKHQGRISMCCTLQGHGPGVVWAGGS